MKEKDKKVQTETEQGLDKTVHDIAMTDFALQEAMEDAGMEAQTYGIWGFFWRITKKWRDREKHLISKKKYILMTFLTGWFGGHRFYAKRFYLGAIYLVFFWTFIPVMMSVLDIVEVIPMKADENGCILL